MCANGPDFRRRRTRWAAVAAAILALLGGGIVLIATRESQATDRPSLRDMQQELGPMREGTRLTEAQGKFQVVKDRTVFLDERTGKSWVCLENLMLQRVESFLSDDEDRRHRWRATGRLTEYQGENFLWLERALRTR